MGALRNSRELQEQLNQEDRTSELEDRSFEIIQSREQKEEENEKE